VQRRTRLIVAVLLLSALATAVVAQRGYRRFERPVPDGPLVGEPKEWTFARLAYDGSGRRGSGFDVDYPGAEQHVSQAVERLTRIDVHPDGYVVSPNTDKLFDYPWLYGVEVWSWTFTEDQAARMREHLLRGGFLMVDDFHGEYEWQAFMEGMRMIFPDRLVEDIPETDAIYANPYEIGTREQVPGPGYMSSGLKYERPDGVTPHWRGIRDDDGRWMVVISHNIDYGEGWEQADNPRYPQPFTRQAYEVAVDYLIYSMTH
jgi:uncharacterized protein DUF4159